MADEFRTTVSPFGVVVVHRSCGQVVVDEDRPTEREIEEACSEHDCEGRSAWD